MPLPLRLRRSLQQAYAADFGREISEDEAEALGIGLLNVLGPVFLTPAVVHRSGPPAIDDSNHKREPEEDTYSRL